MCWQRFTKNFFVRRPHFDSAQRFVQTMSLENRNVGKGPAMSQRPLRPAHSLVRSRHWLLLKGLPCALCIERQRHRNHVPLVGGRLLAPLLLRVCEGDILRFPLGVHLQAVGWGGLTSRVGENKKQSNKQNQNKRIKIKNKNKKRPPPAPNA